MSLVEFLIPFESVNAPVLPAIDETPEANAPTTCATVDFFQAPDAAWSEIMTKSVVAGDVFAVSPAMSTAVGAAEPLVLFPTKVKAA